MNLKVSTKSWGLMMGWKWDYFHKVSVFENLSKVQIWPKRKYHVFSHLIWRKFQVFDKVFGNFENLYLVIAIKINYGGGLGRFEVQKLPTLSQLAKIFSYWHFGKDIAICELLSTSQSFPLIIKNHFLTTVKIRLFDRP